MKLRYYHRAYKARFRDQRHELRSLLDAVRPGDTALDIGANKGSYLYWLRRAVGAAGQVFAYEPQPSLAAYLRDITQAMRWQNVAVRDCALSDTPGTGTLNVPGQGDSPGASLETPILGATNCHSYACAVDTLDRQLAVGWSGRLAAMKVDVEGHELAVFRGAAQTLVQHRPVILVECEARHLSKHTMREVFVFLEGLGYVGQFFTTDGLRPLAEFRQEIHQPQSGARFWDAPGYCSNFLFTPRQAAH
jgi:FkbM family methyltransferase